MCLVSKRSNVINAHLGRIPRIVLMLKRLLSWNLQLFWVKSWIYVLLPPKAASCCQGRPPTQYAAQTTVIQCSCCYGLPLGPDITFESKIPITFAIGEQVKDLVLFSERTFRMKNNGIWLFVVSLKILILFSNLLKMEREYYSVYISNRWLWHHMQCLWIANLHKIPSLVW